MATAPDHGILERQAGHPMATACVIVSFCALLGAIAFNVREIGELRAGNIGREKSAEVRQKADSKKFHDDVQKEIEKLLQVDAALLGALPAEGAAGASQPAEEDPGDAKSEATSEEPKAEASTTGEPKAEPAEEPTADDASESK